MSKGAKAFALLPMVSFFFIRPVTAAVCDSLDRLTRVSGAAHCLAIKTYLPAAGTSRTMVVVLHGDLSSGGPTDYIFLVTRKSAELGAVGVAMMRPGYSGDGRTSSGIASRDQGRNDLYEMRK
tara:strand:- start:258 stop:626 length:369 start_codon:yes stop_codon:yes gene_type:complete